MTAPSARGRDPVIDTAFNPGGKTSRNCTGVGLDPPFTVASPRFSAVTKTSPSVRPSLPTLARGSPSKPIPATESGGDTGPNVVTVNTNDEPTTRSTTLTLPAPGP